jgi:hypothetical protein
MACYVHNKSGSHKAGIDLPDGWRDLSKGVHDMVHRVPAAAGDCIIVITQLCSSAHAPFPIDNNRSCTCAVVLMQPVGYTCGLLTNKWLACW